MSNDGILSFNFIWEIQRSDSVIRYLTWVTPCAIKKAPDWIFPVLLFCSRKVCRYHYLPFLLWWRVLAKSLRCLCFLIFFLRFLTTLPNSSPPSSYFLGPNFIALFKLITCLISTPNGYVSTLFLWCSMDYPAQRARLWFYPRAVVFAVG